MFERATSPVIVLIGMMGAGKSTVGRALAEQLAVPFVDNDNVVAARGGASFADQLRSDPIKGRALESECVAEILGRQEPMVFSLGGGAPATPAVEQALTAHAPVVFIRVPEDELLIRIKNEATNRPMLDGDPKGRLRQLLQSRTPLYNRVASVIVDGVGSPEDVAKRIAEAVK